MVLGSFRHIRSLIPTLISMHKQTFSQTLDAIKMIAGILLLGWGFYPEQNQFLMVMGLFLMAVSGIELRFGNLARGKAPSKK